MRRRISCDNQLFSYFCLYRPSYSETRDVNFSFGTANYLLNHIKEPIETILEFKVPEKFENEQFGKLELIFALKIIIEIASYLYIATYPWTASGNRNQTITDCDIIRSGPIHSTLEHFFRLLGTPAVQKIKSINIPLSGEIQYRFPRLALTTRNYQTSLVTEPDFSSIFSSCFIDCNSSDLIIFKDHRLLCPDNFEQYKLLSHSVRFIIHELIAYLHSHVHTVEYSSLLKEVFASELKFVQLDHRQLTFHSQHITFPSVQLSRAAHRLISAINSREGMISDLMNAYIMSTDLVPTIRQKRGISSVAHDDHLLADRTKKKLRYASLLATSEEISHRKYFPPLSIYLSNTNWNLKEYLPCQISRDGCESIPEHLGYHPVTYKERLKFDPHLPFELSHLFNSHNSRDIKPSTVQSCRLEMTTPYGPGHHDVVGVGGMPSNELLSYLTSFITQKLNKSSKYQILRNKIHSTAIAAIGVIVEELATHFTETWRENIRETLNAASVEGANNDVSRSENVYSRHVYSELPSSLKEIMISLGGRLPGPFQFSNRNFEKYAKIQIQGANLQNFNETLSIIKNRLQCLFGTKLSSDHENLLSFLLQEERLKQMEKDLQLTENIQEQSEEYYSLKRHSIKQASTKK